MDEIRLLIVSNDPSARRGLGAIFASEKNFQVLGSFTLDDAVNRSSSLQPDAILLDIPHGMPMQDNGDKLSKMKQECPCSLVVALVENDQPDKLGAILSLGFDGCIPRGIMRGCLVKTLELACQAGILCLPGSFKKIVQSKKQQETKNLCRLKYLENGSSECLTRREMEILQLMATNCSNREIAGKLYISEPTVKTHVSSILRKLGQNNRAQAIVYSFKIGLVKDPVVVYK